MGFFVTYQRIYQILFIENLWGLHELPYLLEGDPGLLEKVGLDVTARQLAATVEVDADELALQAKWCSRISYKLFPG